MKLSTVLFDLDGTLLPMDQDEFTNGYFQLLAAKMAAYGYDPRQLVRDVWAGTEAMIKNNGLQSNEAAFWQVFSEIYGEKAQKDQALFEEFYVNEFQKARIYCSPTPKATETVARCKAKGLRLVLATNPLFPAVATESRIRWAGLAPQDFALYTTYENARFCKPNPDYYREILARLGLAPQECLMVGNDVIEDMTARDLGMRVFLLTDCLINKKNVDIAAYPHGGFDELIQYIDSIV